MSQKSKLIAKTINLYNDQKYLDEAIELGSKLAKKWKNDDEILYLNGNINRRKALRLNSMIETTIEKVAELKRESNSLFENVVKNNPDHTASLLCMGKLAFDNKDYSKALACIKKVTALLSRGVYAIDSELEKSHALYLKYKILTEMGKKKEANVVFNKWVKLDSFGLFEFELLR